MLVGGPWTQAIAADRAVRCNHARMPHANLESSVIGTEIIDFDGKMGVVIQIFQIIWKNTTRQFSKTSFRKKSGKTWKMTSKIHLFRIDSFVVPN